MRSVLSAAVAAATFALALAGGIEPGRSAVTYPWCANNGGSTGSCGYSTPAQCWASVQGGTGTCFRNPFYEEASPPVPQRHR